MEDLRSRVLDCDRFGLAEGTRFESASALLSLQKF